MVRLISSVEDKLIVNELKDKLLCKTQRANNEIYIVDSHNAPNTVREIGRLRELSFRNSGGGSGKSFDLDEYDSLEKPFKQLIVWNPEKREIIGGYRFLCGRDATFDTEGNPGHDLRIGQKSAKTRACKASILHRFSPKVHFLATELRRRHCGGAPERGLGDLCYSR